MRTFRFNLTINVDGVLREAGHDVPESEIPSGCLASLIRLGQVVEVVKTEPPPEAEVKPEPVKLADAKPPELKTHAGGHPHAAHPKSPAKK